MRGEKLLLYLAVLLLVIGVYFYTESRQSRQLAEEKASKQVFQVKVADINAITLKNDKGEIDLERVSEAEKPAAPSKPETPASGPAEDKWRLTKPIATKADELTITSLLAALTDLKMQRHLDDVPNDKIKEFGLDKPLFTLEFQAASQTHQLRFGQTAPGNQNIYAKKDDESRVLLIRVADKETLDRNLTALRAKDIFSINPEKVSEIRIIRHDDRLIFHKTSLANWTPGNDLKIKLRDEKINSLLKQISGVKAAEFVAEKADDLKKYGLVPSPALRLTLLADGQEETLLLGSKQGDRYYAQVSGTAPIILVDQTLAEKLPTSYEALEDRRLWAGPDTEVQKVVWGTPDKLMTAVRDQNGWSILNPDNAPAGQESAMKLNLVFWRLKDLEFTKLLPTADTKKEKGPLFTLQLLGPEDKLLFKMAEFSEDKDQAKVTFSQGEKALTGIVSGKAFSQLKDALNELATPIAKIQEKPSAGK
jgi:Domain of unknown function (DUF4340)